MTISPEPDPGALPEAISTPVLGVAEAISTPVVGAADKTQAIVQRSALTAFDEKSILAVEKRGLPVVDPHLVPAGLVALAADVEGYVRGTRSEATRTAYAKDWRSFVLWMGCPACPAPEHLPRPAGLEEYAARLKHAGPVSAEAVALYVAELVRRGRKLNTIERSAAAIAVVHQLAGFESPTRDRLVRDALRGVRRHLVRLGRAAPKKKAPITVETVASIVRELDVLTLAGQRNAALLCFGLVSALRREELARLDVHHLRLVQQGLVVGLPWSKSNQVGDDEQIPVPFGAVPNTCPVRTLQRWLASADIESGPVFRRVDRHDHVHGPMSPKAIAEVVKRCAARIGMDPDDIGGHSLRSGFATSAAKAKKSLPAIMRVTRHRDMRTAAGYIREATLFDDAANEGIGL